MVQSIFCTDVQCTWLMCTDVERYRGVKSALKKVDGKFKCKRIVNGVVNSEAETGLSDSIERVKSFVYLGDQLNAGGGCECGDG